MFQSIFGKEGSGRDRYQFAGLMVIIAIPYWALIRLTFLISMPLSGWELIGYLGILVVLMYLFYIGPLKKEKEAQQSVAAIEYADSIILRGKKEPADLMLGFKEVYEIDLDFDNDDSLLAKLKSKEFKKHYHTFLQNQFVHNVEKSMEQKKIKAKNLPELLNKISEFIKERNDDNKTLELENILTTSYELLPLEESENDGTKEDLIPYEHFDLEKIEKNEGFRKGKKLLKQLKYYYARLEDKENFDDEEEEFDECFLIMAGDYRYLLKTHKEEGTYKGWDVKLSNCYCFWVQWWHLTSDIPVFFLLFSENMAYPALEIIKNIKAEVFAYLQLKIMEVWMNDLAVRPEKLQLLKDFHQQTSSAFKDALSDTIQEQAKDNIVFSRFLQNPAQKKLEQKIEKYRRYLYISLSFMLIVILIFSFMLVYF